MRPAPGQRSGAPDCPPCGRPVGGRPWRRLSPRLRPRSACSPGRRADGWRLPRPSPSVRAFWRAGRRPRRCFRFPLRGTRQGRGPPRHRLPPAPACRRALARAPADSVRTLAAISSNQSGPAAYFLPIFLIAASNVPGSLPMFSTLRVAGLRRTAKATARRPTMYTCPRTPCSRRATASSVKHRPNLSAVSGLAHRCCSARSVPVATRAASFAPDADSGAVSIRRRTLTPPCRPLRRVRPR